MKLEKAVAAAVREYMRSDDFQWDDDGFDDIAGQYDAVEDAIRAELVLMDVEIDEDSAEFDDDMYNDEYSRLSRRADRIANNLLAKKLQEFNKGLEELKKKVIG